MQIIKLIIEWLRNIIYKPEPITVVVDPAKYKVSVFMDHTANFSSNGDLKTCQTILEYIQRNRFSWLKLDDGKQALINRDKVICAFIEKVTATAPE